MVSADCACKVVQALLAEYSKLQKRVKRLEALIPRWISVKERLPEENQRVVVWVRSKLTENEWLLTDFVWRGEWAENPDTDVHEVTHWMPLPKPPKRRRKKSHGTD